MAQQIRALAAKPGGRKKGQTIDLHTHHGTHPQHSNSHR